MIELSVQHRDAYRVEPICKMPPIAPPNYHAHVAKPRDLARRSGRPQSGATLKAETQQLFEENMQT